MDADRDRRSRATSLLVLSALLLGPALAGLAAAGSGPSGEVFGGRVYTVMADFDGDGLPELGGAQGDIVDVGSWSGAVSTQAVTLVAADLDEDGNLDLAVLVQRFLTPSAVAEFVPSS